MLKTVLVEKQPRGIQVEKLSPPRDGSIGDSNFRNTENMHLYKTIIAKGTPSLRKSIPQAIKAGGSKSSIDLKEMDSSETVTTEFKMLKPVLRRIEIN